MSAIISGRSSRPIARIAVRRPLPLQAFAQRREARVGGRPRILGLQHPLLQRLRGGRCRKTEQQRSAETEAFSTWLVSVPVTTREYSSICVVRSQGYEIFTSVILPPASVTGSSFGITKPVYDGRFR